MQQWDPNGVTEWPHSYAQICVFCFQEKAEDEEMEVDTVAATPSRAPPGHTRTTQPAR